MKLHLLAQEISCRIETGSEELEITSAAGLDIAGPSDISFLANPKYTPQVQTTRAGAVILNDNVVVERDEVGPPGERRLRSGQRNLRLAAMLRCNANGRKDPATPWSVPAASTAAPR